MRAGPCVGPPCRDPRRAGEAEVKGKAKMAAMMRKVANAFILQFLRKGSTFREE
jgi:hypothetical protein